MNGRLGEMLIILLVILILFGAGRLPQVMRDIGRGVRAFRSGMNDDGCWDEINEENTPDNSNKIKKEK